MAIKDIFIFCEHKSYTDKAISFQLLRYMAEIWITKLKKQGEKELPVIIPLVIYHGAVPWNIETRLGSMLAGYKDFNKKIRKYVPDYEYLVYDITNYTDEEIKGEARVRILFTLFRDVQRAESIEELIETIEKVVMYLQELEDKQTGIEYFETVMRYVFSAAKNLNREDVDKIVNTVGNIYPEGSDIMMTLADILRDEGKKEGEKEGIKKGKELVVKNALKEGVDLLLIEKLTGVSKQEIEKIAKEMEN